MAAKSGVSTSISAELMQKMNPYGYKKFCAFISECDSISLDFYKASKWENYFTLDTSLTFKNGKVNPDHVYELLGSFNGLSAQEVRMHLLEYIYDNIDFFECRSLVCLPLCGIGMNTWVDMLEDSRICCDELALLGLSAMYQRHCLVVTKNKFCSTIETKEPLSIINLMKECSVRLLYLGNLKFGTLLWQPRNPQPAKPKLGQFKIIEEYTLDEPTTSGESSTADNGSEGQVETATLLKTALPLDTSEGTNTPLESTHPTLKTVEEANEHIPVHVETSTDTTTVKVETLLSDNTKDKTSTASLCMKDLKVVVPRLEDMVSDELAGTARSHVETELKPVITSIRGYNLRSSRYYENTTDNNDDEPKHKKAKGAHPSRSGPSPERLLAHANALISKVSSFVSEPADVKHGGKKPEVLFTDKNKFNVETAKQSSEGPLPVEMSDSSTPVRNTQNKPACTIRCKICIDSFSSIKELNEHHQKDHGVVDCELCDKKFTTQTALDRHMYLHNDLHFVCEDCGWSFQLKSRLEQHWITHQADLSFMCKHKGCDRGFKNKGDFNRHMHSHDDVWFKCDSCPYKNKDKRNRDSHMRIHQEKGIGLERYHCERCRKAMRFNTQLRRHKETGCDVLDLHVETPKGEPKEN